MVDLFLIQVNGLGGNDNDNLKKAQMDFNDFFCHDAIIKNIIIDRNTPGINDNISFSLELPEKEDKINFIFEDVYWSAMELNFGISADETVFSAFCSADNNDLNLVKSIIYGNIVQTSYGMIRALCSAINSKDHIDKIILYLRNNQNFMKYNKFIYAFRLEQNANDLFITDN